LGNRVGDELLQLKNLREPNLERNGLDLVVSPAYVSGLKVRVEDIELLVKGLNRAELHSFGGNVVDEGPLLELVELGVDDWIPAQNQQA